jgi:tape measure domain-containing protein
MSQTTELLLRIRQQGGQELVKLQGSLKNLGQQTSATNVNFKELAQELKKVQATSTQSINNLKGYANAWKEIANSVDVTSDEFRIARAESTALEASLKTFQGSQTAVANNFRNIASAANQAAAAMRTTTGLMRDPFTGAYRGTAGVTQYGAPIGPALPPDVAGRIAQQQREAASQSARDARRRIKMEERAQYMGAQIGARDPLTGALIARSSGQPSPYSQMGQQYARPIGPQPAAGRRGLPLGRIARTGGAIAAAGIFGGPEGALGAGIGSIFGGPAGAAVGGAVGAQVGQARQALGGTASYAADLQKQRLALQLVTKNAEEYQRALKFISTTSKELAIPQDILTRQFTKLSASVLGAGGNVADTEKAFKGVTAGIRGTGGSLQDLDSALTATSQVFSKGKVSAEELRQQIGERLPGAFSLFAESLGMTPQELDKALEKGQVSLQDFQKFAEKLFNEYGDAAKTIADSPAAAGDRLKTALSNLSASVGTLLQPIGAAFQTAFANIANAISAAADELNRFFGIAGKAKMTKITEALQREAATLTRLEQKRTLIKGSPSLTEKGKGVEPETLFLDRQITQAQANFDRLQKELFGLQAVNRTAQRTRQDKPKGLPGIDPTAASANAKGAPDFSVQLANALIAAQNELNPIKKIQLEYDAEILKINESKLKPEGKRVALNAANVKLNEQSLKLGNQMAAGNAAVIIKDGERNRQIEQTIQNLEIESGVIDEKQARQLDKDRLIAELQQGNNKLTEEQLQRIDKAYEGINKKTSESMQLFKQIGQNVVSALSDAFMSLFDQAKSLREVLTDLLRSTARLFVEFGLRAGMKSIFRLCQRRHHDRQRTAAPKALRKRWYCQLTPTSHVWRGQHS